MATMDVKDAAGSTVSVEKPNANGRQAGADSRPVALDAENTATLDAIKVGIDDANNSLDALVSDTTPATIESGVYHVTITPTLDTSAYASGDTLFATTEIANATKIADIGSLLQSLAVIDKSDQGVAMTLYFFSANVTFGTANSPPSISDTDALTCLGWVDVGTGDFKDVGGARIACVRSIGLDLTPASGGRSVYVAATVSGTPTYANGDLAIRFGFIG